MTVRFGHGSVSHIEASRILGFDLGALYKRSHVHGQIGGGNVRKGIVTVADSNVIALFTGLSGRDSGYYDYWDDDGTLHYFGEGKSGDMQFKVGNKAITQDQRQLLVFQQLGGGIVRFLGEFKYCGHHRTESPGKDRILRTSIVFHLKPIIDQGTLVPTVPSGAPPDVSETESERTVLLRTKQALFRRRVVTKERACRLTGIQDLRFLRASHIKPWRSALANERVDGNNGLLLTPTVDLLFDHGWISFRNNGNLLVSEHLPEEVPKKIGVALTPNRKCGSFSEEQQTFLEYHRDCIFADPVQSEMLIQTGLFNKSNTSH